VFEEWSKGEAMEETRKRARVQRRKESCTNEEHIIEAHSARIT